MVLGLLALLQLAQRPCMAFVPCTQWGDYQPEVDFVLPSLTDDGLAMTCGELVTDFTLNEGLTNSSTCVETLLGGSTVKALAYEMAVKYGCCGLGGCSKCGGETDDDDPDAGCQVEPGYFDHAHRTNQVI